MSWPCFSDIALHGLGPPAQMAAVPCRHKLGTAPLRKPTKSSGKHVHTRSGNKVLERPLANLWQHAVLRHATKNQYLGQWARHLRQRHLLLEFTNVSKVVAKQGAFIIVESPWLVRNHELKQKQASGISKDFSLEQMIDSQGVTEVQVLQGSL